MSEDGGVLGRWSRLKRTGAAAEAEGEGPAEAQDDGAAEITAEEIAALPPVETITAGTDLTAFLRRGVPPLLRQAALRRMWRVNPAIRDYVDDARDYAFDWNAPGGAPGGGVLSQDAAAKLLGRIFGPAPTAPAAAPAEADASQDDAQIAQADAPAASAPAAPETAPAPDLAPRKRHGGATPA